MHALILANGAAPEAVHAARAALRADLIIATDGAANTAISLGITPHIVCGDFDSLNVEETQKRLPITEFLSTPDQNYGDMEKALEIAEKLGVKSVTILGAAGGRIDHTLANFALLLSWHKRLDITIEEGAGQVRALSGKLDEPFIYRFAAHPGDTLSLIAASPSTVSISGVRWPLEQFHLLPGTRAVSNEVTSEEVQATVLDGELFLCMLNKEIV